ncbi:hypothetical protein CHS0354_020819, partial [Potamilus streckersoni]
MALAERLSMLKVYYDVGKLLKTTNVHELIQNYKNRKVGIRRQENSLYLVAETWFSGDKIVQDRVAGFKRSPEILRKTKFIPPWSYKDRQLRFLYHRYNHVVERT